jgi:hypothetical protein
MMSLDQLSSDKLQQLDVPLLIAAAVVLITLFNRLIFHERGLDSSFITTITNADSQCPADAHFLSFVGHRKHQYSLVIVTFAVSCTLIKAAYILCIVWQYSVPASSVTASRQKCVSI